MAENTNYEMEDGDSHGGVHNISDDDLADPYLRTRKQLSEESLATLAAETIAAVEAGRQQKEEAARRAALLEPTNGGSVKSNVNDKVDPAFGGLVNSKKTFRSPALRGSVASGTATLPTPTDRTRTIRIQKELRDEAKLLGGTAARH